MTARRVLAGAALALAGSLAGVPAARADLVTATYVCDRGVTVPAAYINADGTSYAVIHVEGRQIALQQALAASGVRYAWPSDGAGYVWWTKGPEATLYWSEGNVETPLLTCRQQ